jgi:membrane associated rhomboid family serine protease
MDYAGDGSVVYHYGARNIQSVLTWIFKNFRRPTDICLTGCSAGGTAVLPVYRAFHNHYNGGLNPLRTQINAIADSPVYLTPQYFLDNALDNWLPDEYFKRLGIPYERYRSSEEYSTLIWDFILRKGSNKDRFAIVSHTDDPVSQVYYQWMSGNGNNGNGNDVTDEWYQDLTSSVGSIQSKHKNLQTYWIDGEGHCSFGLYYALQESPDFAAFAGDIFRESNRSIASRQGFFFFLSVAVAAVPVLFLLRRRRSSPDGLLKDDEADMKSSDSSLWREMASLVKRCPCTAAYGIAVVVYFLIMIFNHGFVHPLNNPSLGPSATALSAYGINNPSLVVLKFQWFRLISSNFVSSGVLALAYVIASLWWRVRLLEDEVGSSFLAMVAAIALFINGVYCLFGQGASTSSVGLVIGLRSLELALFPDRGCNISWASMKLFLEAAVFALLVPFNNWILLLAALLVGPVVYLSRAALQCLDRDQPLETRSMVPMATKIIVLVGLIVFPIAILVAASPDPIYKDPFYTGCRLYWSDQVEDLASGSVFRSDNNDDGANQKHRRRRNLIDYDGMCAQFCIPNLVAPLVAPITKRLGISVVAKGQCVDNGYETRAFTKTFSYATYALDVDVYYGAN